jgi:hypothetical protein
VKYRMSWSRGDIIRVPASSFCPCSLGCIVYGTDDSPSYPYPHVRWSVRHYVILPTRSRDDQVETKGISVTHSPFIPHILHLIASDIGQQPTTAGRNKSDWLIQPIQQNVIPPFTTCSRATPTTAHWSRSNIAHAPRTPSLFPELGSTRIHIRIVILQQPLCFPFW